MRNFIRDNIKFNAIAIGILFLSIAIMAVLKAIYVDNFVSQYTGVSLLGGTRVFINDAVIFFTISALFYLSYLNKISHIAAIMLRCIAFVLLLVYAIDIYIITNFANRLTVADTLKYVSYAMKYIQQTHDGNIFILAVFLVVTVGGSASIIFRSFTVRNKLSHSIFTVLIAALFVASTFSYSVNDKYIHSWVYKNVISYNLEVWSAKKEYSEEFIANLAFEEKYECLPMASKKPNNIVLLMVESLSSYQSEFFSGINNWTPNLDAIARENLAYNNFFANGFTTEDGEISLLTGQLPIYQPSSYSNGGGQSFNGFFDIQVSLPNILKKHGYLTEFLTTADLEFANTGSWARSIGFDYVEGHELPSYERWERFHFKAAPDEALYSRIIERIRNNNDKNHFYFVKTVSTHHPFINPETKIKSEEEAFKYADMQLGRFYKKLTNMNFFDKGMLIIVGDHHAMVPLKHKEIEKYGSAKASAMVPLIVAYGDKIQYLDNQQYQQIDVFNSVSGFVSGARYYSNWMGSIFDRKPAKYIAHRRGDNRNIISIISGKEIGTVMLDGDDTRIISEYPESTQAKNEIIRKINSVRINQTRATSNKEYSLGQPKAAPLVPHYAALGCR